MRSTMPANSTLSAEIIPHDFPDWLSPMLVKEVRQGLRGWIFVGLFCALHACMIFWTLLVVCNEPGSAGSGFFWAFFVIGLGVISARGIVALGSERTGNTLELLQISHLTAWKIIAGKWCALVAQMAVFTASLLPYFFLRYYFGIFDANGDGKAFVFIVSIGGVVSALAVFLSTLKKWIAWILAGLTTWLLIMLGAWGIDDLFRSSEWTWAVSGSIAALAVVYTPILLASGAAMFASISESSAGWIRLLGWATMLPAGVLCAFSSGSRDVRPLIFSFLAVPAIFFVVTNALVAKSALSPLAVRGFAKRGFFGKLAALVFAPSRAAGLIYTLVTGFAFAGFGSWIFYRSVGSTVLDKFLVLIAASGALVFLSAGLAHISPKRMRRFYAIRFWVILAALIAIGVGFLIAMEMKDYGQHHVIRSFACISPAGVIVSGAFAEEATFALCATIAHWAFAFALLARPTFREFRNLFRLLRGERIEEVA